jgi:hypothetical protein
MNDIFRPHSEPARTLYDAFQNAAKERELREDWLEYELQRVYDAAVGYAKAHNLHAPSIQEVMDAETSACGHTDYGAKWAYRLEEIMNKKLSQ